MSALAPPSGGSAEAAQQAESPGAPTRDLLDDEKAPTQKHAVDHGDTRC